MPCQARGPSDIFTSFIVGDSTGTVNLNLKTRRAAVLDVQHVVYSIPLPPHLLRYCTVVDSGDASSRLFEFFNRMVTLSAECHDLQLCKITYTAYWLEVYVSRNISY